MSKFTGCISTLCTTFKGLLKAVDLPSEIANMQQHIMTAGNVGYANHKPSERRTVSGDSPHRRKKGYRKLKPVAVSF